MLAASRTPAPSSVGCDDVTRRTGLMDMMISSYSLAADQVFDPPART
jgi:hypothetical protein